jgi:hypothetical protein
MTGINHVVTGAVIAGVVQQPALALPLAFASHFMLDSMPHFGFQNWDKARLKQKRLINGVITVDVVLIILIIILFISQGAPTLFYIAGFVAFSPDLAWVHQFIVNRQLETSENKPHGGFNEFHERIQSRERPSGIYIEVAYLFMISVILINLWP